MDRLDYAYDSDCQEDLEHAAWNYHQEQGEWEIEAMLDELERVHDMNEALK